ncbi:WD repeat-containing protein 81 isoform X2 [Tribolium madens]|uniref:WD repeat-containing protein 81 isoform X2 n=1 Tax=Tribolium madens TaxID=41895 RepID=UPI001CF75E16|nr:WD repeat-containing protein 81 isoform X2 [Tribolium madens]
MDIFEELGVPKKYLKPTTKDGHYIALVHKSWLKSLVKYSKLVEFIERGRFDAWPVSEEELGTSWSKVFICVFKKRDANVIPLPRIRSLIKDDPPLLFCQLMQHIYQTNYKNLWKEAYKKYNSKTESNKETQISLVEYNEVLREIITRIYGCPIVNICDSRLITEQSKNFDVHLNILPAVCAVETLNAIFVIHMPYFDHNLKDCVTFSPAILNKCYAKPLFIIYQLLQTLKSMHDRSLTLGDISLNDIYLTEDMWIYIIPSIHSNIYVQETKNDTKRHVNIYDCRKNGHKFDLNLKCEGCGIKTYDKVQVTNETLQELCQLWVEGQISNFTYISALNKLSGRKLGDPNCHHVFPWVTDFASRCGKNWRDLKKSKYRLNKGDRQLDLTYENASSQVPHHVSDVLSSITYYVYMARRTPKSVLCKNVRTIWVPAEYPSSIQRMQEWTPDECIPEFFTDPTVFKSIHDDLDDLEVPTWCAGPEDFIEKHREALESAHVSERLHYWIDLTFGYKLAGTAAIKAKNVCLHLVDDHTKLMKSGIVQLFTHPHPPKATPTLFWNKIPPKIYISKTKSKSRDRSNSPALALDSKTDDEDVDDVPTFSNRSLGLSRFLSRSRSSLNEEKPKNSTRSLSSGPKNPAFASHLKVQSSSLTTGVIYLPKEYRPEQYLENLEKKHSFFSKSFHLEEKRVKYLEDKTLKEQTNDDCLVQNAFTNLIFSENFEKRLLQDNQNFHRSKIQKNENHIICNYSDIISARRIRELQILGCLIVEIFMSKQLRALGANDSNLSFTDRFKACLTVVKSCAEIPPCISYVVHLLLQPDTIIFKEFKYPSVTNLGLPPPSAHQLLEPLLHSVIPFSRLFPYLYSLIATLKDFKNVATELGVLYHFDCNGEMCAEYESLERTKVLFAQNIGECKVKSCARNLESLLEELNTTTDLEVANILIPHIQELIEDPPTSVLAAWYLFDPLSRVLGPQKTAESLLEPILKLYENEPTEATLPYYGKIAKLYHHSFLLRLIVRLGLKCFLDNLVAPLVEAVGRYKDYEKVDFILHTHSEKFVRKTSHLKTMDTEHVDTSGSDDSSVSSDKRPTPKQEVAAEPEVFDFDDDKQNEEQLKSLMEHLELNVASDLPFNHSTAEEALDATLTENLDQLRSLEELTMNLSEDDIEIRPGVSSPTIPIPSTKQEFSNISCEVGSKKSDSLQLDLVLDSPGSTASDQKKPPSVSKSKKQDAKISDMSSDSLVWLSHRLGPVLTARYLSRNLLKMLTLCYVGKDNLTLVQKEEHSREIETLSVVNSYVLGDQNAVKVLECLTSIAGLYGEQLILFQYIPHMSELIALCKRRLTPNLEGGLISCLALLQHVIPYLSDSTLMDHLQDVILKNILHPIVRLLASTKYTFPSGYTARNILARKYLDTLYVLSIRMGSDMTRTHLAVPALQRFFLIFDKVFSGEDAHQPEDSQVSQSEKEESHYVELCRDGSVNEWSVGGKPIQISRMNDTDSGLLLEDASEQSLDELRMAFTTELAYTAYLPFLRHIGANSLEISLKNHSLIKELCQEYEQGAKSSVPIPKSADFKTTISASSSIGSNIALVGNRIDVQTDDLENVNTDLLSLVSNRLENNSRHLRGNWLAYWEHEIGRSDKDTMFNFKQIKLQTFAGHTHSVKCLYVLDNENSFISGSRDKTVKLWSLRSQGDGSSVSTCQWTYTAHKKSVLSITFIESMRLVASCDSVVHIWDPFMGVNVGHLESPRYPPVNVLRSLPAPSSLVFAATTDGTVKVIDTRTCSYIHELKVSLNPTGLIRCLAVSPSGAWVATGQSSGTITVLDTRTGLIISTWKAHESEVLQLIAADNSTLISSSLDQTIGVWNASDGKFKFHLRSSFIRGATEPVHCLNVYNNELISGTTANRIGVHTSIDMEASFSSTKLRSDAFKGLLTSMALLPLNRLLLLGADTGTINLLC